MNFTLRCHCGRLQGQLASTQRAGRARCYCRDCQAFARFLGNPSAILDESGGTDIVATVPGFVSFSAGQEQLRCVSLSPTGLLRWYAACCRTPIGNTPRDPRLPYVGLVRSCLAGTPAQVDAAFGPARMALHTRSARSTVAAMPWATLGAVLKIMRNGAGARLTGQFRKNPFFEAGSARPIAEPQVLTLTERRELQEAD